MSCNSKLITWRCPECGTQARTPSFPVDCVCGFRDEDGSQSALPGIVELGVHFTKAVVNHVRTGRRRVSEEKVNERLAICKECPSYDHDFQTCKICGCKACGGNKFRNKLAWADQECPRNLWHRA